MSNDTVPAAATGLPNSDPIFAAIEKHKEARAAFNISCGLTDAVAARKQGREITDAERQRAEYDARAEEGALDAVAVTVPTTVAGLLAGLAYLSPLATEQDCLERFIDTVQSFDIVIPAPAPAKAVQAAGWFIDARYIADEVARIVDAENALDRLEFFLKRGSDNQADGASNAANDLIAWRGDLEVIASTASATCEVGALFQLGLLLDLVVEDFLNQIVVALETGRQPQLSLELCRDVEKRVTGLVESVFAFIAAQNREAAAHGSVHCYYNFDATKPAKVRRAMAMAAEAGNSGASHE